LICLRRWKPGAPTRCRRWRDRPHRLGLTTDRDHKFSAGLCRRCHDQALTPTSILCPASASAATGISRCIRPVPTMPVRRSLSVRRPGFSPHPPELHTAGRRIALKPPYPAHRPLLRSLRRKVEGSATGAMWQWRNYPPTRQLSCRPVCCPVYRAKLKHACLKPMQAASTPIRAMLVGVFVRRRCSAGIDGGTISSYAGC
jgi:hypothetical protein